LGFLFLAKYRSDDQEFAGRVLFGEEQSGWGGGEHGGEGGSGKVRRVVVPTEMDEHHGV